MRNDTKAMRLNTRAKLSWYRRAWRPVFSIFKIWGVSEAQALLGRFRGVRGNLVLASLLHLR